MSQQLKDVVGAGILVVPTFRCWSGRKKIAPEEVGLTGDALGRVFTLGSKLFVDPARIRELSQAKSQFFGRMDKIGKRFGGGWFVDRKIFEDNRSELDQIVAGGRRTNDHFLAHFDQEVRDWREANPDQSKALDQADPVERVRERLHCGYMTVGIELLSEDAHDEAVRALSGLGDEVLQEVADEALKLLDRLDGADECGRSILRIYKRLAERFYNLSFVDSRFAAMQRRIESTLAAMPKRGRLSVDEVEELEILTRILINPGLTRDTARSMSTRRPAQPSVVARVAVDRSGRSQMVMW